VKNGDGDGTNCYEIKFTTDSGKYRNMKRAEVAVTERQSPWQLVE